MEGFHVSDGLFFKRLEDGSVQISKYDSAKSDAQLIFKQVVDRDGWPSVMASMCADGETAESYRVAIDFHKGLIQVWSRLAEKEQKVLYAIFGGDITGEKS